MTVKSNPLDTSSFSATGKSARPLAAITGASSGIGLELAKVFNEEGYDLIVAAEDEGIFHAAERLNKGGDVTPVRLDLATREGNEALYGKIKEALRPLDVLVINAGVGSGGEFVSTSLDKEINLINLNVAAPVMISKWVVKDMVARGEGKILFTSSIVAEAPGPFEAVYAASKAFVQSFAIALRHEVKDKGVVITALQPGATETSFFARADMLNTKVGQSEKDDPAQVARQGFDALMEGEAHVVGGSPKNRVMATASKLMPEELGAKASAAPAKPV